MSRHSVIQKGPIAVLVLTGASLGIMTSAGLPMVSQARADTITPPFATPAPTDTSAFSNLPGVKPLDPLGTTSVLSCEQVLVDRALGNIEPTRGPRYHTLNVCRRNGGPEFSSPRLPPSSYRQLRGFDY